MLERLAVELSPLLQEQLQPLVTEVAKAGEWRGDMAKEVGSLKQKLAQGSEATDALRSAMEALERGLGPKLLKRAEEEHKRVAAALAEVKAEVKAALAENRVQFEVIKSEKRVLQRSMSDEKGAAVALLQEKLDTQSRAAEELGGTLASLRGAHEAAKAQVARQQAARLVWKGRLPCLRTAHLRPHRTPV